MIATTASARLRNIAATAFLLAGAGCSRPEPPQKEQPPEPQASQASELRDAIRRPIDQAKGVEAQVQGAAQQQQAAIDAQAGG